MTAPKRLGEHLPASAELAALLGHLQRLQAIESAVKKALPAELGPRVRVANLRDGTLVLFVPDPIWAARLRLIADTLPLQPELAAVEGLRRVTVKVSPPHLDSP